MYVQYAIDGIDVQEALWLAELAVDGGIRCIEAGHVLVKAAGVDVVRRLRDVLPPDVQLVVDMKTMDMAESEVELVSDNGGDTVIVCGAASDGVIDSALTTADRCGISVLVSLMGVRDRVTRCRELIARGAHSVIAHRGHDDTFCWTDPKPFRDLQTLAGLDGVRLAVAGAVDASNISHYHGLGLERVIVGRGISESADPSSAARAVVALATPATKALVEQ